MKSTEAWWLSVPKKASNIPDLLICAVNQTDEKKSVSRLSAIFSDSAVRYFCFKCMKSYN